MEGRSRTTAGWVSPLSPTVESSTRTRKKSESCGSTEFRQCLVAVPGGGDPPRVVVEAQLVHCSFELFIAARARRYPSAESLEVEQRPGLRIVVGHSEQQPLELFNEAGRRRRCDCEVAVVERLCACDHADAGGFEQPLRLEELLFAMRRQVASTSPATRARAASRSPPTWSPCLPPRTSKPRTVKSSFGCRPDAPSAARGRSVACGESGAPTATVRPFRSDG